MERKGRGTGHTGKMEEGTTEGKRNISVLFNIYLKALIYLI